MTDPVHEGHLDHILKASYLGDFLFVITHPEETLIAKKGYYLQTFKVRSMLLEGLLKLMGIKGLVIMADDRDGTVAKTLERLKPDIFAKGGDRRDDSCMPPNEVAVCQKYGIQIVYGCGDLLGSSSNKILEIARKLKQAGKI